MSYRDYLRQVVEKAVQPEIKEFIVKLPDVNHADPWIKFDMSAEMKLSTGNLISQAIAENNICQLEIARHNIDLALKAIYKAQISWADPGAYTG